MNPRLRAFGAPVLLFGLLVLATLAAPEDLDNLDQAKTSLYVLDICENGRWLVPMQSSALPATKPPLQPWLAALVAHATGGPSEAAVRAPSIAAGLGVLLLTVALGLRLGSARLGCLAGTALATSFLFAKLTVIARPDMLHTLFTTAAFACAVVALERDERGAPSRWPWLAAFAALGGASLAKSPVSIAIFALALLLHALASGGAVARLRRVPWLTGTALALTLFLAWLGPALLTEPRLAGVLGHQAAQHVLGEAGTVGAPPDSPSPVWYYAPHLLQKLLPWSLILVAGAVAELRARRRAGAPDQPPAQPPEGALPGWAVRFAASWTVAVVVVLSCVPSKRSDYILPAWPTAALLTAHLLLAGTGRGLVRLAGPVAAVAALAAALAAALLPESALPPTIPAPLLASIVASRAPIALGLLVVAVAGAVAGLAAHRRQDERMALGLAVAGAVLLALNFAYFADKATSGRGRAIGEFCRRVAAAAPARDLVVADDVNASVLFFLRRAEAPPGVLEGAARLGSGQARYLVTGERGRAELARLGVDLVEVDRTGPYVARTNAAFFLLALPPPPRR